MKNAFQKISWFSLVIGSLFGIGLSILIMSQVASESLKAMLGYDWEMSHDKYGQRASSIPEEVIPTPTPIPSNPLSSFLRDTYKQRCEGREGLCAYLLNTVIWTNVIELEGKLYASYWTYGGDPSDPYDGTKWDHKTVPIGSYDTFLDTVQQCWMMSSFWESSLSVACPQNKMTLPFVEICGAVTIHAFPMRSEYDPVCQEQAQENPDGYLERHNTFVPR